MRRRLLWRRDREPPRGEHWVFAVLLRRLSPTARSPTPEQPGNACGTLPVRWQSDSIHRPAPVAGHRPRGSSKQYAGRQASRALTRRNSKQELTAGAQPVDCSAGYFVLSWLCF